MRNGTEDHSDVIIVGAGFSGLIAAREILRAGLKPCILEADSRVGGRTKPGVLAGRRVDCGGQWVAPTQTHLLDLAAEFGVETVPQRTAGIKILQLAGRRYEYDGDKPDFEPAERAILQNMLRKIDSLSSMVDPERPWITPNASALDSMTVASWSNENVKSDTAISYLRLIVRSVFSAETDQISFLHLLGYTASAGGIGAIISTQGGAQDSIFIGGAWQLAERLADQLDLHLVLQAPVTSIKQTASGVDVESGSRRWSARRLIVTVPPPMAARINYSPPLPAQRDGLMQRLPMGSVIKLHVAYAEPFWRNNGYAGFALSDAHQTGPWFDNSGPDGDLGALVGFLDGAAAQIWTERSRVERNDFVLEELADLFGNRALAPIDYLEEVWPAAEFQRGGYACVPGPGVLTRFGPALRAPIGQIHWAGTETSSVWQGYIDGAIRAGKRAAQDVVLSLNES